MPSEAIQQITCTVKRPMNSYGALTLESVNGSRTFQVVGYGSHSTQAAMARRRRGDTVRVQLKRINGRGDTWRVVGFDTVGNRTKPRQSPSPVNG